MDAFAKAYKSLNKQQKLAVDTIEGPVMVIAGPGTGKTTILTLRIANILLKTDTMPESILALTFTDSGAYAMRRKLASIIGNRAYKVNMHTFHGFASKIIEEQPDYFPRMIGSTLITDAEQINIIECIIAHKNVDMLRPFGDKTYYIKPIINEIKILKRENISPVDFEKSLKKDEKRIKAQIDDGEVSATEKEKLNKQLEKNKELAFVYKEYEDVLSDKKYYDYDDMLLELIRAMSSNKNFKLILQENYQYILADEHQDANASQNRILELLSDFHDSPNLFIVGDDKQAIYRFQGASLENFLYFKQKYSTAVVIDLENNYRSHQGILDVAHELISNNPEIQNHKRVRLTSTSSSSSELVSKISLFEFKNRVTEISWLADKVEELLKNKTDPEEIAIIYRDNSHAIDIAKMLRLRGIRYRIESDQNILKEPEVIKLITILKLIHAPDDSKLLATVLLFEEFGCDPVRVSEILNIANRERISIQELLNKEYKNSHEYSVLKKISKWTQHSKTHSFLDILEGVVKESGIVTNILKKPNSIDRMNSFTAFYDHVSRIAVSKKTFMLSDFVNYIDTVSEHGISGKKSNAEHIHGVRLMTAHKSKGLEFEYVFIVHLCDGIWGNRKIRQLFHVPIIEHMRDSGRIEDERRLFYVAITRAKSKIFITYSLANLDREYLPSEFIAELPPKLVEFEKVDSDIPSTNIFKQTNEITDNDSRYVNSILDKEFIKSKFISQPLSVTHINNFLKCPWNYFFVNLIRIPEIKSKHQLYGTAIHNTLRMFFDAYKFGNDYSVDKFLEIYEMNVNNQPFARDEKIQSIKKGRDNLRQYYRNYYPNWRRTLITEYSITASDDVLAKNIDDNFLITGKLDKIEFINDRDVIVVDYKTGKPKSRNDIEGKTKDSDGNYKRQLVFYQLLLDATDAHRMIAGELDFVEPNEKGKFKTDRFEILVDEVGELRQIIIDMYNQLSSGLFIEQECSNKDCEYCALAKIITEKE